MRLHLQAEAGHAKGVLNAFLPIHDIAAWNDMDHFAVRRNGNRAGNLNRSADIVLDDIPVAWRDRHEALTVLRTNMAACDPHLRWGDLFPERRSARSSAAAMEVTVSSIFTTTPRRNPCEGQVPTPTIFSFPSRSNSPTRTQIFVVPTSIPTITRSCTIHAPLGGCMGIACDARALRTTSLLLT